MTINDKNFKYNGEKITIKLKISTAGCNPNQKANILGLGLKKINQQRTLMNNSCVRGMIKKVIHMLEIK
ncbi:MAG: 50S ribosomal protein L30 [Oligoflexia bacterium]|nr:50S ribosomal protein L30 [Oligoflexia bacterium]